MPGISVRLRARQSAQAEESQTAGPQRFDIAALTSWVRFCAAKRLRNYRKW